MLALLLSVLASGCATARHAGKPIAEGGRSVARVGTAIICMAGVTPFTIPLCVLGLPFLAVGAPLYYGGNALAGEKPDLQPFEL